MRFVKSLAIAVLTASAGCAQPDVTGPFTGRPHDYAVDTLTLPRSRADFADDLNGDGRPDNQLGAIAQVLAGQGFAGGNLPQGPSVGARVTLLSDDDALQTDARAAIVWQAAPDAEPITLGGRLEGGRFR